MQETRNSFPAHKFPQKVAENAARPTFTPSRAINARLSWLIEKGGLAVSENCRAPILESAPSESQPHFHPICKFSHNWTFHVSWKFVFDPCIRGFQGLYNNSCPIKNINLDFISSKLYNTASWFYWWDIKWWICCIITVVFG